jgi:hypothetical protein
MSNFLMRFSLRAPDTNSIIYSAEDKEGDPRFKGFLDAPVKTKTITR